MVSQKNAPRELPPRGGFSLPQSELLGDVVRLVRQLDAAVERANARSDEFRAAGDLTSATLARADFDAQMYSRAIQIFSGMTVEATVNVYGVIRFGEETYERRFQKLPLVKRLCVLIREATGKTLEEDDEIVGLASAIMARRNAHAHLRARESGEDFGLLPSAIQRPQPQRNPAAGYQSAADLIRFVELFLKLDPEASFFLSFSMPADQPTPLDQYLEPFRQNAVRGSKAEAALEHALDIRKFEIELYWKRAAYFWTFIAAAFAGYFVVLERQEDATSDILFAINCLGFTFSICWYFANRGSKFWQENWEQHVDLLEDDVTGPLYKTVLDRDAFPFSVLFGPFAFSLSKINTILSLYVTGIWLFLGIRSFSTIWNISEPIRGMNIVILAVLTLATIGLLYREGQTTREQSSLARFTRRVVSGPSLRTASPPDRESQEV